MTLWPSRPWKITLSKRGEVKEVEPELPFALIGPHKQCTVRIPGAKNKFPPVVYFACSFTDAVQVWPLCAIAYPRWGKIRPEEEMLIGRIAVTAQHIETATEEHRQAEDMTSDVVLTASSTSLFGLEKEDHHGPHPDIVLGFHGKCRTVKLRRRVTILGDQHPSTVRVHGQNLAPCDHAIVTFEDSVWVIDLRLPRQGENTQQARKLEPDGTPIEVGNMTIALDKQPANATEAANHSNAVTGPDAATIGPKPAAARPPTPRPKPTEPRENAARTPKQSERESKPMAAQEPPATAAPTAPRDHVAEAESLASEITDRLITVRKSDTAAYRKRLVLAMSVTGIIVLIAGAWLASRLLW